MIPGSAMDSARFLREHWQRKPLLIRADCPFKNPLAAEELAGLALEPDVEARLVRMQADEWQVEQGPLRENSFSGDEPWTLLVQRVDHYVPEVAALRHWVNFLPSWRLDDVMVSYATDGGGVGPHYDNYDVFLLQGEGQRRWQLGQHCDADSPLRDNPHLRILAHFEESESYLLNPGDILYVPPGLAHWGTSVGAGMTYSIGFRAPRLNDMLSRQVDELLPAIEPEQLYRDPVPLDPARPGELTDKALEAARSQLTALLASADYSADWFGELVTESHREESYGADGAVPSRVVLDPASRLAWFDTGSGCRVYANGTVLATTATPTLLVSLCSGEPIDTGACADAKLLQSLWETGCLVDDG